MHIQIDIIHCTWYMSMRLYQNHRVCHTSDIRKYKGQISSQANDASIKHHRTKTKVKQRKEPNDRQRASNIGFEEREKTVRRNKRQTNRRESRKWFRCF